MIGRAIGRRLTEEGAYTVLADIGKPIPADISAEFEGVRAPGSASLDVTQEENWVDLLANIVKKHGRLDVLVNNAGVVTPEFYAFDEFPLEEWKRVFSINVEGAFLGTKIGLRTMKATGGGAIVNIGSIAGYVGSVDGAAYGTSKGSVRALTKQAALSSAKLGYGVRVNAVHPAYVWTPLITGKLSKKFGDEEAAKAAILAGHPLGILPSPADIAAAVAFLASDDARAVTGSDLVVDAGRLL